MLLCIAYAHHLILHYLKSPQHPNNTIMPAESIKTSKTDLLIIGAGPAGLMAANFAAACGLRDVRIIDKRNDKVSRS